MAKRAIARAVGIPVVALVAAALATAAPDDQPGDQPSTQPSAQPTVQPSAQPTAQPSAQPTAAPTAEPTAEPTAAPRDQAVVIKQFLRKLETDELVYGTPETLVQDGYDCCQKASEGVSGPQIADHIAQTRGLSTEDSNVFALAAVKYLCPQYIDSLTGPRDCGPFVC